MKREIKNGSVVTYLDEYGREHNALVTECWSAKPWDDEKPLKYINDSPESNWPPCINIVYVTSDPNRKDQYGRQTVHESSVSHVSQQSPNMPHSGRCWKLPA